jgi:Isochorismatase family
MLLQPIDQRRSADSKPPRSFGVVPEHRVEGPREDVPLDGLHLLAEAPRAVCIAVGTELRGVSGSADERVDPDFRERRVVAERGGEIFRQVQAVFPDQKPIDRMFINSLQDSRVVAAVKKTGRKKLVIAAFWSEMCLAQPAIHAMGEGYDVYLVTDASGGVSPEAHDMAIRRLVAAGAQPITWIGIYGELQHDCRAQRNKQRLLRSCSTMPAVLVLHSRGKRSCCVPP